MLTFRRTRKQVKLACGRISLESPSNMTEKASTALRREGRKPNSIVESQVVQTIGLHGTAC